jgi:hypothetical protein
MLVGAVVGSGVAPQAARSTPTANKPMANPIIFSLLPVISVLLLEHASFYG